MREWDVIVVGGGHAGCEAALACARRGVRVALVTLEPSRIAHLPCNCSIGGPGKAHLIREIAALGGAMPHLADATATHTRLLNTSKGPAVQAIRVQVDKTLYPRRMQALLSAQPALTLVPGEVAALRSSAGAVTGVRLGDGQELNARAVILATGTFLNGMTFVGAATAPAGRHGEAPATLLSASLVAHGLRLGRLKTGTTPRLAADSIDYTRCEVQPPEGPLPFAFAWQSPAVPPAPQLPCYLTYTTPATHAIIRANLERSALYGGLIVGRGPRYCPSIEDKVVRFAERERHQIFLEREGWDSPLVYPMGVSTSLPRDAQEAFIHSIPGLEAAVIVQPGYAVEYDFAPPDQLWPSLESKALRGLFCAGQFNGTSGYEEAAGQGLLAGINAGQYVRDAAPVVLRRDEAYLGVLIDDLVTKGTEEPYRMLTSRAEHRLLLRQDNADLRLAEVGAQLGLIAPAAFTAFCHKRDLIAAELARLAAAAPSTLGIEAPGLSCVLEWLRRPEARYAALCTQDPLAAALPADVAEQVEISAKYDGYIRRQSRQIATHHRLEGWPIPHEVDYRALRGLSREAIDHLTRIRPQSVGQAARIPGITPADISLLLVWLHAHRERSPVSRETL
jgi:tRNA uridine 5-carboxymethylaminomethyl modification enzyme